MLRFTDEPLYTVVEALEARLAAARPGEVVRFEAPDPDAAAEHFAGEPGPGGRRRSLATWAALAAELGAVPCMPERLPDGFARLGLRKLDPARSWQRSGASGDPEKYGADSRFARVRKFEEPAFALPFRDALRFVDPPAGARILALGCNRGDELAAVARLLPDRAATLRLVGVDHCPSALAEARRRLPDAEFIEGDLRRLDALALGRFDLVLALNTLHSPSLDGKALFRALVSAHLRPTGAVIVGLPDVRYVDGEPLPGAAVRGFAHPELSVVLRDAAFYKRYLATHRFRVMVTGLHTVLVCGRPLPERVRRQRAQSAPASG